MGGAVIGLDKVIETRVGKKTMGFGADVKESEEKDLGMLFRQLQPEDLLKYGLIPEFIGRIPMVATLEPLDRDALVSILTEPKNAITKQYKRLMRMDGVDLDFTPDSLTAIAAEALKRKTGARALRSIVEEMMLDVMYEAPSRGDMQKVVITQEWVENRASDKVVQLPETGPEKKAS